MLALYQKSERFIINTAKMCGNSGPELQIAVRARIEHFHNMLPSIAQDIDDSDAAMDVLQKESAAFTKDQRQEFAKMITIHMSSKMRPTAGESKFQRNLYLYNYFREAFWKVDESRVIVGNKERAWGRSAHHHSVEASKV